MMKNLSLTAIAIGLIMVLAGFAADRSGKSDFEASKEIIVMRNIAHQILLYAGDSSSPIGPVTRISAYEFQIPFQSSFSFMPDSLVRIIDKVIASNQLPTKYIVTVLEPKTDKVIYGYAVMGPEQKSIVPCGGRNQPARPYCIDIKFQAGKPYPVRGMYMGGTGMLTLGLLMLGITAYKRRSDVPEPKESAGVAGTERTTIAIGRYIFYPDEQLLKYNEEQTVLTDKESRILSIFANAPNQVIDRKRLQKEIWEDEGVIVGRSLDMFISRLRKKLESDPDIKLVNIHSKGYKLEIKP